MSKINRSESEIIKILKEVKNGIPIPELCPGHGIGRSTYGGCS